MDTDSQYMYVTDANSANEFTYTGPLKSYFIRNISKVFSHFLKYINGLSFTIHVIKLSCNFVSIYKSYQRIIRQYMFMNIKTFQ